MAEKLNIVEYIDKAKDRFCEIAPQHIQYASEKGFAVQVLSNNSYLMEVAMGNPASLLQAVTNVAAIGLSLNPAEKLAYLIPRSVKVGGQYQSKIFLEPSYMGLCKLATDTGSIKWVQANCVYEKDSFVDNGMGKEPEHKYNPFSKDRGPFVGVYCVAKTSDGDYLTTIMTKEEVESIRDRSEQWKKSQSGPWKTDFNEQAKKTVVRRAFKMWPRSNSSRMDLAVDLSNENEGFESLITSPSIRNFTGEQKSYFDNLISKGDSIGMFIFRDTLCGNDATSSGYDIWASLCSSFNKGEKGKYREIVEKMVESGQKSVKDYSASIEMYAANEDDLGVKELLAEMSQETKDYILGKASREVVVFINNIQEAA